MVKCIQTILINVFIINYPSLHVACDIVTPPLELGLGTSGARLGLSRTDGIAVDMSRDGISRVLGDICDVS